MRLKNRTLFLSLAFALLLAGVAEGQTESNTNAARAHAQLDAHAAKIREQVKVMGLGHKITVDRRQGEDLHGSISNVGEESFEIVEVDQRQHVTVRYDEVKKVRGVYGGRGASGHRPNPRTSLLIGAGVLGFLFAVAVIVGGGG